MDIPKPSDFTKTNFLGKLFQGLGAAASILALFLMGTFVPNDLQGAIYAYALLAILLVLISYVLLIHFRKLHRYAEAPSHVHYIAHTIRDILVVFRKKAEAKTLSNEDLEYLEGSTRSILDSMSHCFSMLAGTYCSVCVKEFEDGLNLRVAFRDSHSAKTRGKADDKRQPHPLEKDTPCDSIFCSKDGSVRVYLCNNVFSEWKGENYNSPSFDIWGGEPADRKFLIFALPPKWCLPYKSCIVAPIRYVYGPETLSKIPAAKAHYGETWNYWGFLCVDAKKRNVFDKNRHQDLIATFSDLLYIYFNELYDIINQYTGTSKQ